MRTIYKEILLLVSLSLIRGEEGLIFNGETHFNTIRQLTFSGENAEAYFSPDGKELIFQAHDGAGLCDQIYIMDIKSGETRQVSTGGGVTTCSFFEYPNGNNIIYSSTRSGGKECPPKPDYSMGYVWKLYPDYEIYKADVNGGSLDQLTNSKGYDAEGTVAFDGSKIVYTSIASGDLEVWTMDPGGQNKKQLTDRLGYDGGPFFSHDGNSIVWRAYYPSTDEEISDYIRLLEENTIRPMALQIWTMNIDGSNKKQVTNNGAANFGPFFFPNDKRIIFSSNMHDPKGRNFDLYAINIDGTDLERITFFEGFDGFPMFSPDGKFLVFASNRNQEKQGDTNLFICEWRYE
mgnify:CR=1 FL=1